MQFPSACQEWPRLTEMKKKALFFSVFFVGWALPATVLAFWPFSAPEPQVGPSRPAAARQASVPATVNEAAVLHGQVRAMARTLFQSLEDPDPENGVLADGVIVCTFVDLKKLYRTSSFGRYLAEQLMTELQQRRYTVVEMRKSNDVLVQEKRGEYGLSRDPKQIRETVAAGAMLTGTYTQVRDHVIVNAEIVDNRSAALLASATAIFPRSQVAAQLLADSISATTGKAEPIYMKRLEL